MKISRHAAWWYNDHMTDNEPTTNSPPTPLIGAIDTPAPLRRLTKKEKGYIAGIAEGKTRRDAVKDSYDVRSTNKHVLDTMADKIEKRPQVLAVLQANEQLAQETLTDVMRYSREYGSHGGKDGAPYARVAIDGANSLLDRIHGKAKQSIDITSTSVNLNVDLTL